MNTNNSQFILLLYFINKRKGFIIETTCKTYVSCMYYLLLLNTLTQGNYSALSLNLFKFHMLVITIRSFSEKFLDFSLDQIKKVLLAKNSTDLCNITRLPKSFKKVTVVRSPHVNKQSKEKFSYTLHTIQLKLKVKDNLSSIELIKKTLPPQVSLKFTTY